MADIARVLIYGDIHLNSKNYGAHRDYARESLYYFKLITEKVKELGATYLIGLGDFTFGRFHTLEYRMLVEKELEEQYTLTKGNRYELKGNHDSATYGMTEYEYYVSKGLLKPSTNLQIGNVNISMVDSGAYNTTKVIIEENRINVVLAHDFFKFKDTAIANYGKAIELDNFEAWYGVDYIICGHIHNKHMFEGLIVKGDRGNRAVVHYPGCLTRPAYSEGIFDTGELVLLIIRDNGEMQYDIIDIPLLPLEESFNLIQKEEEMILKQEKEKRVDISDIVDELNAHNRMVGNPEDIIEAMVGIDERYKRKAIELLRLSQA